MIFSVYDPETRRFRYYEGKGQLAARMFAPHPSFRIQHPLGMSPEEAAFPLPPNAKLIGEGPRAKGVIASCASRQGLGAILGASRSTFVGVLAGWLGYQLLR